MAKQNKKTMYIIIAVLVLALFFQPGGPSQTSTNVQSFFSKLTSFGGGGGGATSKVVEKGVGMKVNIVDENGNFEQSLLSGNKETFSIISATTPNGFISLSPYDCSSSLSACTETSDCPNGQNCVSLQCKCSFLSVTSQFVNTAGDSDITITSVSAGLSCAAGNSDPNCGSVPNAFGAASTTGNKRGNFNSKFSVPIFVNKGVSSSVYTSDPFTLDEVATTLTTNGLVNFSFTAGGTYRDEFGNDVSFGTKSANFLLRAVTSTCADGTPVDYDVSDTDNTLYCSTSEKGKYCRVNTITGYPVYVDRASLCDCNSGYNAVGEVCKATSCSPNSCISGTVNYCLADGKSFETRCQQCGVANCPLDAYSQSATSCNPATSGVISQCVYPAHGASGLQVLLPTGESLIPSMAQCGDGVKNGAEVCDGSDTGGLGCSQVGSFSGGVLACTQSCPNNAYNTAGCTSGYVNFRTINSALSNTVNADGIAWNTGYATTCNSGPLTKAGEIAVNYGTSQTCTAYMGGNGFVKMFDITSGITSVTKGSYVGISNFALWYKSSSEYYAVAGSTASNGCAAIVFTTGTATSISTSANTIDSSKEMNCY